MTRRRATAVLAAAAMAAALLVTAAPRPALSAGGGLDTTFNTTGAATLDLGGTNASVSDLLVQPDGRIVVVGPGGSGIVLVRYTAVGALDPLFGTGGSVSTSVMTDAREVVRQSDGKLVVVGRSAMTDGSLVLERFTATGALDTASFGAGGRVAVELDGGSSGGVAVTLQGDGKIVALAIDVGLLSLFRFETDGTLDNTFGSEGRVDTGLTPSLTDRVAIQADGKIIVSGMGDGPVGGLKRFAVDGSVDTYGTSGLASTANHVIRDLAIQPDGKSVAVGDLGGADSTALVVRRNTDGVLDPSFGTSGVFTFGVTGITKASARGVALQTDGKIVVTGRNDDSAVGSPIFVARLTSNGALDPTFASAGVATFSTIASKATAAANAIAVESSGKLVAGGAVLGSPASTTDMLVFRVLVTGTGTSSSTSSSSTTSSSTTTTVPGHTPANSTARSDPANTVPTATNDVVASVTTPTAGVVKFTKEKGAAVAGYKMISGVTITAPAGTAAAPLRLEFALHVGSMPATLPIGSVVVLRNGVAVEPCTTATTATPDPCVAHRVRNGDVMRINVLTSTASTWQFARPVVQRIAGASRVESAISASRSTFADDGAGAVVLARSDRFADALAATPLAVEKDAPLLLSDPRLLDDATLVEIIRVLPPAGTVYVLGGVGALSDLVEDRILDWGFDVVRIAGLDRFETAVAIADALGNPDVVVETTGLGFSDALAAGAVAAKVGGAVLLTAGAQQSGPTLTYIVRHRPTRYAIGGPASVADSGAEFVAGEDRYETAVLAALAFFPQIDALGFASGTSFPDALSGGTHAAHAGAPLLLVPPTGTLPVAVDILLRAEATSPPAAFLYGGTGAVGDDVATSLRSLLGG